VSKSATIPEFVDGDAKSMSATVRAMKQVIETLTGQRQGDSLGAPSIYVQTTVPNPARNKISAGDIWINSAENKVYYFKGFWQVIG